ncbi:hypothetical protein GCM10023340_02770 [Nocardioides marinquilinus]|uniref:Uncharacterized protein n=1 Tax=Nocardioides marinquilinus TaxID=1210400 RepID=A0ABP9P5R4_9ACTN
MASTLACLGMHVDDLDRLGDVLDQLPADLVGRVATDEGVVESVRHRDDSGACVVLARLDGGVVDLVPTFESDRGARLGGLGVAGEAVVADVLDDDGETVTRLACDLVQRRHVRDAGPVDAAVVALGVEVGVHADAAAFAASDDSVLGEPEPGEEPMRLTAQSFVSYGLFSGDADPEPTAFLAGEVLAAESRTHAVTGQSFHVLQVETVGFTATVCLAASEHPTLPAPGSVVAGVCYLVADAPDLWSFEPQPGSP